jgi:D-beta-D-heptose 7-phosphate kinase/D-beta-D-heptose 1-phosphate adenosyltransferase
VVISDYAKGFLTAHLCQQIIGNAHARGKKVVIDPRPQHASFYTQCDYLTPNWKESQGLLGFSEATPTDEEVERTGRLLTTQFETSVLLTLGARGIAFFPSNGGDCFRVAAAAKEVFDVSGAGDTVVAAFALATAAGCEPVDAVSFANRAAGIVVGKRGTATVSPEEFLASDHVEAGLVERDGLRGLCMSLKSKSRRVVTVTGTFDVLQRRHLLHLRRARREGDVLIIGLRAGRREQANGGSVDADERAEMLLALRPVDFVHVFHEDDASAFLEAVRPDAHIVCADDGITARETAAVERHGGRVIEVDTAAVEVTVGRAASAYAGQ